MAGERRVGGGVLEEVIGRDGAEQGAPVVADDDLGLVGGVPLGDLVGEVAQGRGLAGFAFAEDEQERVGFEVHMDRFEAGLADADGDAAVRVVGALGKVTGGDLPREEADRGGRGALPGFRGLPDEGGGGVGEFRRRRCPSRCAGGPP